MPYIDIFQIYLQLSSVLNLVRHGMNEFYDRYLEIFGLMQALQHHGDLVFEGIVMLLIIISPSTLHKHVCFVELMSGD